MAWIKLDHFTPDKPELIQAASILEIDQDAVLGKCIRLWIWADQQSVSGNGLGVTKAFLDRLVSCPGFTDALKKTGWLVEKNGCFSFPNFERHNGESAKKRAETNRRVSKHREIGNANVTEKALQKALPDKIRVDQIREEEKKEERTQGISRFAPPSLDEVKAYCTERGNKIDPESFIAFYASKGWKVGAQPMRDWKSAVITWEKRENKTQPVGTRKTVKVIA